MSLLRPLLFALAAGFVLSACATPASDASDGGTTPPAASAPPHAEPPPAPEENPMTCNAKTGLWAKGEIADEALVARVKADTGSDRVRVIKPGMAVTMDYREDRLNLDVDADNRVVDVRCG